MGVSEYHQDGIHWRLAGWLADGHMRHTDGTPYRPRKRFQFLVVLFSRRRTSEGEKKGKS